MAKLSDILITHKDYTKIDEIEINYKSNKFIFGVRNKKGITREDMQELLGFYYDLSFNNNEAPFTLKKGECARYKAFVKYYIDDEGKKELKATEIISLPKEIKEKLDEYIPNTEEVLSSFKNIVPRRGE